MNKSNINKRELIKESIELIEKEYLHLDKTSKVFRETVKAQLKLSNGILIVNTMLIIVVGLIGIHHLGNWDGSNIDYFKAVAILLVLVMDSKNEFSIIRRCNTLKSMLNTEETLRADLVRELGKDRKKFLEQLKELDKLDKLEELEGLDKLDEFTTIDELKIPELNK